MAEPGEPAGLSRELIALRVGQELREGMVVNLGIGLPTLVSSFLPSGEEVLLSFETGGLPPLPPRWRRTYFLHLEGWEKDGDFNVAFSETVEPFPFRAMKGYPPSGADVARGADRPSRHVSKDRLHARVRAAR